MPAYQIPPRPTGNTSSSVTPAASSTTAVHAAYNATAANIWTGVFTSPAVPRNLTVAFSGTWDGGDVTVTGTRLGATITETFTANPGNTVTGTKVFDTAVSAVKTLVGSAGNASIGTGTIIGMALPTVAMTLIEVNATAENITFYWPSAALTSGYRIETKKIDSSANTITVKDEAGGNIDGSSSGQVLGVQWDDLNCLSDGSSYLT